ncbi:hypothetical protein SANTM175S_03293 [Streptomyces antimycoticus]
MKYSRVRGDDGYPVAGRRRRSPALAELGAAGRRRVLRGAGVLLLVARPLLLGRGVPLVPVRLGRGRGGLGVAVAVLRRGRGPALAVARGALLRCAVRGRAPLLRRRKRPVVAAEPRTGGVTGAALPRVRDMRHPGARLLWRRVTALRETVRRRRMRLEVEPALLAERSLRLTRRTALRAQLSCCCAG